MKFSERALQKMVAIECIINAQSAILSGRLLTAEKDLTAAIAVLHDMQRHDLEISEAGK